MFDIGFGSSLHNYRWGCWAPCYPSYSGPEPRFCNEGDSCLRDPCLTVCLIDLQDVGAQGEGLHVKEITFIAKALRHCPNQYDSSSALAIRFSQLFSGMVFDCGILILLSTQDERLEQGQEKCIMLRDVNGSTLHLKRSMKTSGTSDQVPNQNMVSHKISTFLCPASLFVKHR